MRALLAAVAACLVLAGCTDQGGSDEPTASASPRVEGSRGCGSVPQDVEGGARDVARTMDVDGTERTYGVHVPPGYDGTEPLPVVYAFHGLGSNVPELVAYSGMAGASDDHDVILVAPQALGKPTTWDVRTPASKPGSDAAFWLQLTRELGDTWCVDEDRQYAAGMSNGSAVVFAMACSGDFPFQAYAGVAATFYDATPCDEAPPASILYFHGTADEVVPFEGGETPLFPVRSVDAVMADWARHDGCSPRPRVDEVASDVERRTWTRCSGVELEAYVIEGGGHTWPGAAVDVPVLGRTTKSIDATAEMMTFFGLDGRAP